MVQYIFVEGFQALFPMMWDFILNHPAGLLNLLIDLLLTLL